jgi:hypothetical protein
MAVKTSLESKYTIVPSGCWEWNSPLDTGYGLIRLGCKQVGAHRFMFERHKGPIPEGKHLDHLCRNPKCVNPEHLEPVSARQNARRGSNTKMNHKTVAAIRKRRYGGAQLKKIADEFNLSQSHISEICRGVYWGDAPGPLARRYKRINN